jgi:hypothetical protein
VLVAVPLLLLLRELEHAATIAGTTTASAARTHSWLDDELICICLSSIG